MYVKTKTAVGALERMMIAIPAKLCCVPAHFSRQIFNNRKPLENCLHHQVPRSIHLVVYKNCRTLVLSQRACFLLPLSSSLCATWMMLTSATNCSGMGIRIEENKITQVKAVLKFKWGP
jgi:hypothetical protein